MGILTGLSDDQIALIGCAVALTTCGTLMSLSYYLGRFFKGARTQLQPVRKSDPHASQRNRGRRAA